MAPASFHIVQCIPDWSTKQLDICSYRYILHMLLHVVCIHRKVHISEATLNELEGAYQVKPGNGSARNTILKEKNIPTYIVVSQTDDSASQV